MPTRILIVDDEQTVADAFRLALKLAGYTVWTANGAQQALKHVEDTTFDLVILDFIMPKMDGLELLARIRKVQPLVRSIIISGKIDTDNREEDISKSLVEQVEADIYLHKPVSNERLTSAVQLLTKMEGDNWKAIAGQVIERQGATVVRAKVAAKALRKSLKKKR